MIRCAVNSNEKRVAKYKKMTMHLAMATFPMMFKPHLKGDKKAYQTIKNLIKILEPEMSKEHITNRISSEYSVGFCFNKLVYGFSG